MARIDIRDAQKPTGGVAQIVVFGRDRELSNPQIVIQNRQTGEYITEEGWVRGEYIVEAAGQSIQDGNLVLEIDGQIVNSVLEEHQPIIVGIPELDLSENAFWPEVIADFSGNTRPRTRIVPRKGDAMREEGDMHDPDARTEGSDEPRSTEDSTSQTDTDDDEPTTGEDTGSSDGDSTGDGEETAGNERETGQTGSGRDDVTGSMNGGTGNPPHGDPERRSRFPIAMLIAFVIGGVAGILVTHFAWVPLQLQATHDQIETMRTELEAARDANDGLRDEIDTLRARPDPREELDAIARERDALQSDLDALERLYLDTADVEMLLVQERSPSGRDLDDVLGDVVTANEPGNLLYQIFLETGDRTTPLGEEELFLLTNAARYGAYPAKALLASHYLSLDPPGRDDVMLAILYFKSAATTLRQLGQEDLAQQALDRAMQAFEDHRNTLLHGD